MNPWWAYLSFCFLMYFYLTHGETGDLICDFVCTDQIEPVCAYQRYTQNEQRFSNACEILLRNCREPDSEPYEYFCDGECPCGTGDPCDLPRESGPCDAAFLRYYFDNNRGECRQFTYGGCEGNDNNFETIDQCQDRCGGRGDPCDLPRESGPCEAAIPRYYYDKNRGECRQFTYGGCEGNDNNFETIDLCQDQCGGRDPCDEDCPRNFDPICGSNGQTYSNECELRVEACRNSDWHLTKLCNGRCPCSICDQALDVGPCRRILRRYYYDQDSNQCRPFTYGGCGGNQNKFVTLEDCEDQCKSKDDVCQQPMQAGPCTGFHKRYYYNSDDEECQRFIYGGCQGNRNNFKSRRECDEQCGETGVDKTGLIIIICVVVVVVVLALILVFICCFCKYNTHPQAPHVSVVSCPAPEVKRNACHHSCYTNQAAIYAC